MADEIVTPTKFCKFCGAAMVEEWTGYYRATDGQKDMHLICSAQPCEHGAHWHSKVIKTIPNRWWNPLHNGGVVKQCKRCDHTWTDWNFSDY